jgi:hypothetical protein
MSIRTTFFDSTISSLYCSDGALHCAQLSPGTGRTNETSRHVDGIDAIIAPPNNSTMM